MLKQSELTSVHKEALIEFYKVPDYHEAFQLFKQDLNTPTPDYRHPLEKEVTVCSGTEQPMLHEERNHFNYNL